MWPPRRPSKRSGRSRLTDEPGARAPSTVRCSVSAITSAVNVLSAASTTVRQAPLTAIESPRAASAATCGPRTVSRAAPARASTATTSPSSSTIPVNIRDFLSSKPLCQVARGARGRADTAGSWVRLPPARASSHPDCNRRSRNSTGSASRWRCHAFGRVADCHRRLGISPTPEHAFPTGTSVPCRLFRREAVPGPPRPGPRLDQALVVAAGRSAGPSLSRSPAARPLPPGPGCASGEDQRQEDQYNWQAALCFEGIPPDQKDGGAADGDADRDTFQQRAAAPRHRRRCPGRACQARVNTCGYLLVNLLNERRHDRVAVLGAKLTVRLGSRANLLWGQRRSTHMGRLNPGEVAGQEGQRRRFL